MKKIQSNKTMITAVVLAALAFAALFLTGCQSLQRDKLYTSGTDEASLATLADIIVPLDTSLASTPEASLTSAPEKSAVDAARKRVTELEKANVKDSAFEGRVAAWSGRLFLLEGKQREALAAMHKSESLYPGSVEGRVLAIRLEPDPPNRRELCERSIREARGGGFFGQYNEFTIELARVELELGNYRQSAAAFDSALPHLPAVYRTAYNEARNKAWELRNLAPGASPKTAEISVKKTISWEDAIELSKNETQLLRFLSGGKDMSGDELFSALVERNIIPTAQDITLSAADLERTGVSPSIRDTVLRAGAAWYIWHLFAENRADKRLLTRYSSRNPARSPIPDILRASIFFDAVLGCIERQFMTLPDGKNFNGGGTLGGAEFLMTLKKAAGN